MAQSSQGARRSRTSERDAPSISISTTDVQLKNISVNLFSDVAESKAKAVHTAGGLNASKGANKITQLRRFYDELVMWHDKVMFEGSEEARRQKYEEVAPFIQMMIAKVAYAEGREHVDSNFRKMFSDLIGKIEDANTLRNAKLFMEAFMGFYKAEG